MYTSLRVITETHSSSADFTIGEYGSTTIIGTDVPLEYPDSASTWMLPLCEPINKGERYLGFIFVHLQ